MALPPELHNNWDALSQLLDEALTLPVEKREAFVDALSGERAHLRETLRQLLTQAGSVETAEFLADLPRFTQTTARGPLADLAAGDTIGPYRLERELGVGGMGSVWLAERADGGLKRKVALKLPRLAWAKGLAERMARERDILASLEHAHIARLYDAGLDQMGRPYLALEYVEGQPIDVYARERGLSVRQMLDLLLQVCAAVAFAHSRLVVHRDLKPSNILVTRDGQVRLLDFGIAKLMEADSANETQLTQLAGRALTLDYASPEQIKGEPIGTASDVYSLGVVAYELLTGTKPYRLKRGSAAELEEAIATIDAPKASESASEAPVKKALKGDLDAILNKALKKQATDRYATVDALRDDVRRHVAGERVAARPETLRYRARRLTRRYRIALVAGCIVLIAFGLSFGLGATALTIVALLLGLAMALWQARRAQRTATAATANAARAEAVQNYLMGIFRANSSRQEDPAKARQTTARELLDIGRDSLDHALVTQPAARADVAALLSELYAELGLAPEATELARSAVSLTERAYGAESPQHLSALASLVYALSNVGGALEERRAAGDRLSALLTMPHEALHGVRAFAHRAVALSRSGEEALPHLQAAIVAAEKALDHREALRALELLGQRQIAALKYDDAITSFERALAHQAKTTERNEYETLFIRTGLAEAYVEKLRVTEAQALAELACEIAQRSGGPTGQDSLQTGLRLGRILLRAGKLNEAIEMLTVVLTHAEDPARPDRFSAALATIEKAAALGLQGDRELAYALHQHAIACCDEIRPNTPLACLCRERFASTLLDYDEVRQAQNLVADVQERRTKLGSNPGRPDFDPALIMSARCLLAAGDAAAAHEVLQQTYCVHAERPGLLGLDALAAELQCATARDDRQSGERLCNTIAKLWQEQEGRGWPAIAFARLKLAESAWYAHLDDASKARTSMEMAAALIPHDLLPMAPLRRVVDQARRTAAIASAEPS